MADTKESNGLVVVDLCKPYGISMVKEATENNVIFLGWPLLNTEDIPEKNEKLNKLFEKVAEFIRNKKEGWEKLSSNQKEELEKQIEDLSNDKFSSIISKDFDNGFKNFKDFINEWNLNNENTKNSSIIHTLKNKKYIFTKTNKSPYKYTYSLIKKIREAKTVYVVVPSNPEITVSILETDKVYQDKEGFRILAKLFYKFVLKSKSKDYYKDYINTSNDPKYAEDVLFNRKNLFAQFLQAFKIKNTCIKVNISNFPLQYVMQRGTARIINDKRAYKIIADIYKHQKNIGKDLSWLTPSYFEMLILILLKNEYKGAYEAYHTGGTGDYGIDGVLMDNKEHIYAIVQCKSGNLTSNNAKKLVNEIKNNYNDPENTPMIYIATRREYNNGKEGNRNNEDEIEYKIEGKENVRIWDEKTIMTKLKNCDINIFEKFPNYKLIKEIKESKLLDIKKI